jgi:hypothetical protein
MQALRQRRARYKIVDVEVEAAVRCLWLLVPTATNQRMFYTCESATLISQRNFFELNPRESFWFSRARVFLIRHRRRSRYSPI